MNKLITPRSVKLVVTVSFIALLGGLTWSTLQWLVTIDWPREDYSYAYFIPFVIAYLVWDKRKSLGNIPLSTSWAGLDVFLPGIAFYWLGDLAGEFYTQYLSLWFMSIGFIWVMFGKRLTRALAFPLIFSLSMFPFPSFLSNQITLKMKLISSQLGFSMLKMLGLSAYREGNIIDLGFTQLQVVDACSGLRYLIPLILFGALVAYFYHSNTWKKAFLVISSIPLSILTNGLRIAATGILFKYWGSSAAEGFFHEFSGWFIFIATCVLLSVEMKILSMIPEKNLPMETSRRHDTPDMQPSDISRKPEHAVPSVHSIMPSFIILALLASSLVVSHTVNFHEKTPSAIKLETFPMNIGPWTGVKSSMRQDYLNTLDLSDYLIADYRNTNGKTIDLYIAYYESQSKGKSIHSPDTCLPGSGWVFTESGKVKIPLDDSNTRMLSVKRSIMIKNGEKQIAYYWFSQRGRNLTNPFELKVYNFWDALTRQRTDGALVRVITPVSEEEEIQQAEARLVGFVKLVNPVLEGYIPK
jgi:exosortase D (VPLPA-CTERM-specific)